MHTSTPYLHEHNSQVYLNFRNSLSTFWPSEQTALKQTVFDGARVLDVGCNRGGLLSAIKNLGMTVSYTGIDPDPRCIDAARASHPDATFICDWFPSDNLKGSHDLLYCFALFQHFTNWKETLATMASLVTSKLVIDVSLTTDYPTVNDPDCSYCYYFGSGERVPLVVLNLYEFVNYCFTEAVGGADVSLDLVCPKSDGSMTAIPPGKALRGVAIITKDQTGKPIWGGQAPEQNPTFMSHVESNQFRSPTAQMTLDGKKIQIYPKP